MRFSDDFLNELKSRIPLSQVIGRRVKLRKQGKSFVGLSPFSNEKSPSFYVHDDRGFYKCFSTQKSGDVITFLVETENLTFAEAVEKLAHMAGMPLPSERPEDAVKYRRRAGLVELMEAACAWFEQQLASPAGEVARSYLEGRGFGRDAWARHRMGFAPPGWRNLSEHLSRTVNASAEDMLAAGLTAMPEEGKASRQPYDRFRNRVIFPIFDPTGKPIAFGGRALTPEDKPKYINSPETELFHKGQVLYRLGPAREALAQRREKDALSRGLVVCEGYVDAIALAEAGVDTAVAPLGTALTEDQIDLLWRAGPEPILCFDGDRAGLNAAFKAVERALPLIEPGRTLYFALLPDGLDPDDMIRQNGADAMRAALLGASPLVDLLWRRELEADPADTPERRAGLEARLMTCVEKIRHPGVKKAYERELRDRLYQHFRPQRPAMGGGGARQAPPATRGQSPGASRVAGLGLIVRAIDNPELLLEAAGERLAAAIFPDPDVGAIRDAAFDVLISGEKLDREAVASQLRSLSRGRSTKLLESYPAHGPVDLASAEGREWLRALEQFPAAVAMQDEARAVYRDVVAGDAFSNAAHQTRLRVAIGERRIAARIEGDAVSDTGAGDAPRIAAALEEMARLVARRPDRH